MSSFKHLLAWDYASHWRKAIVWVEERVAHFSDCFFAISHRFFSFFPTAESGPNLNICRISDLPHYHTIQRFKVVMPTFLSSNQQGIFRFIMKEKIL